MKLSDVRNKKILLSCLNWGMGHVSRSIGLIRRLNSQNNAVIVAGQPDQLKIFRNYFPEIQTLDFNGYPFEFEKYISFQKAIWRQKGKLLKFMEYEKKWVNEKVLEYSIDLVLSDHRYGFRSSTCCSIFITHQNQLPLKGLYKVFQFFHTRWIKQFNAVWILDELETKLAGKLSESLNLKRFEYIGWHSRFESQRESSNNPPKKMSVLVLSGPNAHLNYLHQYFMTNSTRDFKQIIIGKSSALFLLSKVEHVDYIDSSDWLVVDVILQQATEIFSFFGYSTLMDSKFLSAQFHLIPCPNQWEQEYLSTMHPKIIN